MGSPLSQRYCAKCNELRNPVLRERRQNVLFFFQAGNPQMRLCVPFVE
jgi:hypothetical protein